ncbi:hypothetical protein HPB48_002643 [Haemaphysalis longicornis]|uniref:Tick transposon n=1 Tax=Haemaphysalis longicornis TaxID=44386 RepID=A0A9J6G1U1_HAELO|nr:hypothetical protein HPB48_002643 [Haemaphysalis longicornis]
MKPIDLPPYVEDVLSLGAKFAVEPRRLAPELLSLVHHVSRHAADNEHNRCISEGVDVLSRCRPAPSKLPVKRVATFLKDHSISVVPADKEGGFAVISHDLFRTKADAVVSSVFGVHDNVVISRVNSEAKKLCNKLNLGTVVNHITNSKKDFLGVFFSAKTHKPDRPLRFIVSETGTWQKSIASFLQEKLGILTFDDPFLVNNSEDILDFLHSCSKQALYAFSLNIKDLITLCHMTNCLILSKATLTSSVVSLFKMPQGCLLVVF